MSRGSASLYDCWRMQVDQELSALTHELTRESALLREATLYVLQGAGKKLRALLVLSIVRDILGSEGDLSAALRSAVAVEAVHAASLVHDDLPALDNDDYRRGRLSCHRAFGEATAILVGDLLIGVGFAAVASADQDTTRRVAVSQLLARSWTELCVGQQLDLLAPTDSEQRAQMITLKTGALFGFAAASGGVCAGSNADSVSQLFDWGVRIGVAFQRLDDVDDGECSQNELSQVVHERESLIKELGAHIGSSVEHSVAVVRMILERQ